MKIRSMGTAVSDLVQNCNSVDQEGDGSEDSPYKVCSWAQLADLENAPSGTYYVLGRNLDLSGESVSPIEDFQGVFDGKGYTISHFQYRATGSTASGLFAKLKTAEVKNLVLDSFQMSAATKGGVLAGEIVESTVSNITVSNSVMNASINSGGFTALIDNSEVSNIFIKSTVVFGWDTVGLLAAKTSNSSMIEKVAVQGNVVAASNSGGLVAYAKDSFFDQVAVNAKVALTQNTYYVDSVDAQYNMGIGFGRIEASMVQNFLVLGTFVNTADAPYQLGGFAGFSKLTDVSLTVIAPTSMIDIAGNATDAEVVAGVNDQSVFSDVYYYDHAKTFSNTTTAIGLDEADLSDFSSFSGLDSDLWAMTTGTVSFPLLAVANQAQVFAHSDLDLESSGAMYVTEIEDATNGLTFGSTSSQVWDNSERLDVNGVVIESKLKFTNTSAYPINLTSIGTFGYREAFDNATGSYNGTCSWLVGQSTKLAVGATCTIGIRFYPLNAESASDLMQDVVKINYSYTNSDGETVSDVFVHSIEGEGSLQAPFIANSSINFTDTYESATMLNVTTAQVTIQNTGTLMGKFWGIQFASGVNFSYNTALSTCQIQSGMSTATELQPNDTCELYIDFYPDSVQSFSDTITITYRDAFNVDKTATVALTGDGIAKPFPCGSGTLADPWCVPDRVSLEKVRDHAYDYFIQTADIDMGGMATPLTIQMYVSGVYDGQNHVISNLYSTMGGLVEGVGAGATIKNLTLDSPVVSKTAGFVGAFVDVNSGGTIQNVSVIGTGSVTNTTVSPQQGAGGLVGWGAGGLIDGCSSSIDVNGVEIVGGLVGWQYYGILQNSYSTGNVTASGRFSGGLAGAISHTAQVLYAYATGNVTTTKTFDVTGGGFFSSYYSGGFVGYFETNATISNSYATGDVNSADGEAGGFAGRIGSGCELTSSYATGNVVSAQNSVGGFAGYIVNTGRATYSYSTGSVTGVNNVGGFVGLSESSIVNHNYSSSSVNGNAKVGGFVGYMSSGFIEKTFATGSVNGVGSVGGHTGYAYGTISECFATGSVSASGSEVGGFIGTNFNTTLSDVYATGSTIVGDNAVGGFVGAHTGGSITHAYSLASSVSSNSGGLIVHAFVGDNGGGRPVTESYYYNMGGLPTEFWASPLTNAAPASYIDDPANFVGYDIATPVWKTRNASPNGNTSLTPALAWSCDSVPGNGISNVPWSTISGITCP